MIKVCISVAVAVAWIIGTVVTVRRQGKKMHDEEKDGDGDGHNPYD